MSAIKCDQCGGKLFTVYTRDSDGNFVVEGFKYCRKCSLFYKITATPMRQKKSPIEKSVPSSD